MKPYLRYIFQLALRQRKKVFILLGLIVLDTAARLVQPYLYKIIVDTLTSGIVAKLFTAADGMLLVKIVALWCGLAIVNNVTQSWASWLGWTIGNQSSQWVHMAGFKRLLRLDYYAHTQKHSSQYAKIVDEADTSMWEMTNWWLGRFVPAMFGFVGMLAIALSVNWQLTLVSLSVIPPDLAIIIFMMRRYEKEQHRVNKLWNLKHEHLSDQVTNIITYKLNQNEPLFVKVQKGFSDLASDAQNVLNAKWRFVSMLNPDAIARFLVLGLGVLLVKDGTITLGTLFMFMGLLNEILVPLHLLGDILPQYSRRARHIDRFLKLVEQKDLVRDPARLRKIPPIKGKIEFKNVSFSYPEAGEKGFGLKNVSFVIEPGRSVALVGHSGSGKTTIMSLVTRLVDPTEGEILLDGVNIKSFKQTEYRRLIGTVLQEHSMYNETIAQNIAYGKPRATRREIIAAAKSAVAHPYIEKLPKGYDTLIGERGVRLSGGEKQRLAIARAILKRPHIVVLDEPTSALDSITEAKVQKGLDVLIKDRTCLVIAHRLSTVRNADTILLVKEGRIAAAGSHSELLRVSPDYREMVDLQTGGFLADE